MSRVLPLMTAETETESEALAPSFGPQLGHGC
jgi:hypothetical protein